MIHVVGRTYRPTGQDSPCPASTSCSSNRSRSQADSHDTGSIPKSDRDKPETAASEQADLRTSRRELAVYAQGMDHLHLAIRLFSSRMMGNPASSDQLVHLVYLVYLVYLVCLVGRPGDPTR